MLTLKRFAATVFILLLSSVSVANHQQFDLRVDGLTCPFCIATSARELKKVEGVHEVTADLDAGIISVCAEGDANLDDDRLTTLFKSKGFTYRSKTQAEGCTNSDIAHGHTAEGLTEHTHSHP